MPRRTHYRWAEVVARLRRHPGRWIITHRDVPVSALVIVRLRRHTYLRLDKGHIEGGMLNVYEDKDGRRRGDLVLRYIEEEEPRG